MEYCYSGTGSLWYGSWNRHVCRKGKFAADRHSWSTGVNPSRKQRCCSPSCLWSQAQRDTSDPDNSQKDVSPAFHYMCVCWQDNSLHAIIHNFYYAYFMLYDILEARWETHLISEYQLTWCFTSSIVSFNFFNICKEISFGALLFYKTNVKCNIHVCINVCIVHGDKKQLVQGQNHVRASICGSPHSIMLQTMQTRNYIHNNILHALNIIHKWTLTWAVNSFKFIVQEIYISVWVNWR